MKKVKEGVGDGDPDPTEYTVSRTGATLVTDPEEAKKLIRELCEHLGAYLVIQENGKLQLIEYDSLAAALDTWDANVFMKDISYDPGLESIKNQCYVFYSWDGTGTDGSDFSGIRISVDADSVSDWDGTYTKVIKSKWITSATVALEIAAREVARLKDGVGMLSCSTSLAKCAYQVGDMITVDHDIIVNPDVGEGDTRNFLIVQKTWDIGNNKINWKLMEAR